MNRKGERQRGREWAREDSGQIWHSEIKTGSNYQQKMTNGALYGGNKNEQACLYTISDILLLFILFSLSQLHHPAVRSTCDDITAGHNVMTTDDCNGWWWWWGLVESFVKELLGDIFLPFRKFPQHFISCSDALNNARDVMNSHRSQFGKCFFTQRSRLLYFSWIFKCWVSLFLL